MLVSLYSRYHYPFCFSLVHRTVSVGVCNPQYTRAFHLSLCRAVRHSFGNSEFHVSSPPEFLITPRVIIPFSYLPSGVFVFEWIRLAPKNTPFRSGRAWHAKWTHIEYTRYYIMMRRLNITARYWMLRNWLNKIIRAFYFCIRVVAMNMVPSTRTRFIHGKGMWKIIHGNRKYFLRYKKNYILRRNNSIIHKVAKNQ